MSPRPILRRRLWLFDFDNTLAALEGQVNWGASRRELESFLRSEGVEESLFREFPSRNLPLYNALLIRLRNRSGDCTTLIRRASDIIERYELQGVEKAAPLEGAVDLLRYLSSYDKRLAIVTSNSSKTVGCWLAQHRLAHEIALIVGRDSLLPLKPSPHMVSQAIEFSSCAAQEAVMVGDSDADLLAARCAKIEFVGIAADPNAGTRLQELGARKVFSSPRDFARHLSGARRPVIECRH
jgi:HAD superfamily hydrolase (TIGR01549 family)